MFKQNLVNHGKKYSESSSEKQGNQTKICHNGTLRVGLYIHVDVSDSDQTSIKKRIQACQKFVENNGWKIHDLFVEKTENSENSNRMLKLALARLNSGSCDVIVADADFTCCKSVPEARNSFDAKLFAVKIDGKKKKQLRYLLEQSINEQPQAAF